MDTTEKLCISFLVPVSRREIAAKNIETIMSTLKHSKGDVVDDQCVRQHHRRSLSDCDAACERRCTPLSPIYSGSNRMESTRGFLFSIVVGVQVVKRWRIINKKR